MDRSKRQPIQPQVSPGLGGQDIDVARTRAGLGRSVSIHPTYYGHQERTAYGLRAHESTLDTGINYNDTANRIHGMGEQAGSRHMRVDQAITDTGRDYLVKKQRTTQPIDRSRAWAVKDSAGNISRTHVVDSRGNYVDNPRRAKRMMDRLGDRTLKANLSPTQYQRQGQYRQDVQRAQDVNIQEYGIGGWIKDNAGSLLKTGLGIGASFIPGGQKVGASLITSGVGDMIGNANDPVQDVAEQARKKAVLESRMKHEQPGTLPQEPQAQEPQAMYGGGQVGQAPIDRGSPLTEYQGGGTHEENKYGGIPIGGPKRVEEGEFKFKDPDSGEEYIFSNRF